MSCDFIYKSGNTVMLIRFLFFILLLWYGFKFIGKLIGAILGESEKIDSSEPKNSEIYKEETGINKEFVEDAEFEDIE